MRKGIAQHYSISLQIRGPRFKSPLYVALDNSFCLIQAWHYITQYNYNHNDMVCYRGNPLYRLHCRFLPKLPRVFSRVSTQISRELTWEMSSVPLNDFWGEDLSVQRLILSYFTTVHVIWVSLLLIWICLLQAATKTSVLSDNTSWLTRCSVQSLSRLNSPFHRPIQLKRLLVFSPSNYTVIYTGQPHFKTHLIKLQD